MRIIVLFLAMLLFGCAAIEKQAKPEISTAKKFYRSNCSICHRLYSPDMYSYQKLEHYVKKYGRGLTSREREVLLEYLKENSKEQK